MSLLREWRHLFIEGSELQHFIVRGLLAASCFKFGFKDLGFLIGADIVDGCISMYVQVLIFLSPLVLTCY